MRSVAFTVPALLVLAATPAARAEGGFAAPAPAPEPPAAAPAPGDDPIPPGSFREAARGLHHPQAPGASAAVGLPADREPLAGFRSGLFYLRDASDEFRLYLRGRLQFDEYNYFGPGVPDTALKSTLGVRRFRPEFGGEFGRWQFTMQWDLGAVSIDNPKGTNVSSVPLPTDPATGTPRYASAQTVGVRSGVADAYVNYRADAAFNVEVGQFDAPFTMENRTSDKSLPFLERSLAVRALGIPTNKEVGVMLWGDFGNRALRYEVAAVTGDGQNRPNLDNRVDGMARVVARPLIDGTSPFKALQFGASARYGTRDKNYVSYDYSAMTTQGGFAFFGNSYKSSVVDASGAKHDRYLHVIPSGTQLGLAGELRVPVGAFDLSGEVVYVSNGTREAVEGYQATNTERYGKLSGLGYYVEASYWLLGDASMIDALGYSTPAHLDFSKVDAPKPKRGFQVLAKYEHLGATYDSASRSGVADAKNVDGDVKVDAVTLGFNYYATKHLRIAANYSYYSFPDSAPSGAQTSSQRAVAPGNTLAAGVNDDARANAHSLHEASVRVAVAF